MSRPVEVFPPLAVTSRDLSANKDSVAKGSIKLKAESLAAAAILDDSLSVPITVS